MKKHLPVLVVIFAIFSISICLYIVGFSPRRQYMPQHFESEYQTTDYTDANDAYVPESPGIDYVSIDRIIEEIDERVLWIRENSLTCVFHTDHGTFKECFDYDVLVYRDGSEYWSILEGGFFYQLYYDETGTLIHAFVFLYRAPSFYIYFQDGEVIRLIAGDRDNEPTEEFNELTREVIRSVLEIAYLTSEEHSERLLEDMNTRPDYEGDI